MPIENFAGKAISDTYQRVVQTEGNYLADGTGSIINNLTLPGNLNVSGTIYAQNTVTITQSYYSGSNIFGDEQNDTQKFTGSVFVTGSTISLQGGSFSGSGANLFNIPASGITGLNLSQIATGSITASVLPGTGSFIVTSGSTNLLFVSSSGNLGLGTTTPGSGTDGNYLLDINGNALIRSQLRFLAPNTPTTVIQFRGASGAGAYDIQGGDYSIVGAHADVTRIRFANTGIHWQGVMSFWTKDANTVTITERLRINEYGFIGIGTTTPTQRLDVSGSARFSGNLTITGSATNSLLVKGSGTTSATTAFLVENSAGSTNAQIYDDGQWFIGTGNIRLSGTPGNFGFNTAAGNVANIGHWGINFQPLMYSGISLNIDNSIRLTGSTFVTGSLTVTGSTILRGNTSSTGSISISGSAGTGSALQIS